LYETQVGALLISYYLINPSTKANPRLLPDHNASPLPFHVTVLLLTALLISRTVGLVRARRRDQPGSWGGQRRSRARRQRGRDGRHRGDRRGHGGGRRTFLLQKLAAGTTTPSPRQACRCKGGAGRCRTALSPGTAAACPAASGSRRKEGHAGRCRIPS
jgi:hypothetical protein